MTVDQSASPPQRRLRQLEAARGFAAVYVFAHHYVARAGIRIRFLLSFSTVAVMLFFLLSGFVIHLTSGIERGEFDLRSYARKRALRIMPPYVVALALSYGVAQIVRSGHAPVNFTGLLGNLLFVVDFGRVNGVNAFHGNPSLWSLSFEVWFYVFFAAIVCWFGTDFARLRWYALSVSVIGFVTVWVLPNPVSQYAVVFVIWWAGAELAHEWMHTRTVTLWGQRYGLGLMAVIGALTGGRLVLAHVASGMPYARTQPVQILISVIIVVVVIVWKRFGFVGFDRTVGLFLVFGPISYGIYLFHYPIIRLATDMGLSDAKVLNALWVVPAVFLFSWVFDLQLHRYLVRRTRRRVRT